MVRLELSPRHGLMLLGLLAGLWLLVQLWSLVVLVACAFLVAGALMPYVDWLWRRTHNRPLAVLVVVFGVLLVIAGIMLAVIPTLFRQGRDLWEQWPAFQAQAAHLAAQNGWTDVRDRVQTVDPAQVIAPRLIDTSRVALNVIVALVTAFFLAAYLLVDARRLKQFLYFSTPKPWHRHIRELLPALQRVVGGYIRGQAITSASVFVFTFVVLAVLGVPNALALAAIAAVADLIPLIGIYVMLVPVLLSALPVSITATVVAIGLLLAYQQFEDRVLIPRIYGQTLRLPTIVVVLAILAGAEVMGLTGALLALPVAAGIRVVVEYFAAVRTESAEAAAEEAAPAEQVFAPDTAADQRQERSGRSSAAPLVAESRSSLSVRRRRSPGGAARIRSTASARRAPSGSLSPAQDGAAPTRLAAQPPSA